jgi:hypothetical protein
VIYHLLFQLSQDVVTTWEGGAMLRTTLKRSDFSPRGELRLKCVASVMGLYNISSGSVAIWLEQGKPPAFDAEDTMSTGDKSLKLITLLDKSYL